MGLPRSIEQKRRVIQIDEELSNLGNKVTNLMEYEYTSLSRVPSNPYYINNDYAGQLRSVLKGCQLFNSMKAGVFTSGIASWLSWNATLTVENDNLIATGLSNDLNLQPYSVLEGDINPGDKWFSFARVTVLSDNAEKLDLLYEFTGGGTSQKETYLTPTKDVTFDVSMIRAVPQDAVGQLRLKLLTDFGSVENATGAKVMIDGQIGVFAINLTASGLDTYLESIDLSTDEEKKKWILSKLPKSHFKGWNFAKPVFTEKVVGKNLFDESTLLPSNPTRVQATFDGLKVRLDNSTKTSDRAEARSLVHFENGKSYSVQKFNVVEINGSLNNTVGIAKDGSTSGLKYVNFGNSFTWDLSSGFYEVHFVTNDGSLQQIELNVMVVHGDVIPTKYEKYDEHLRKIDVLEDCPAGMTEYDFIDANGVLNINWSPDWVTLDGSENWLTSTALNQVETIVFVIATNDYNSPNNDLKLIVSEQFTTLTANEAWNNDVEGIALNAGDDIHIRVLRSKLSSADVAGFKAWLSLNNVNFRAAYKTTVKNDLALPDQVIDASSTYSIISDGLLPEVEISYPANPAATRRDLQLQVAEHEGQIHDNEARLNALENATGTGAEKVYNAILDNRKAILEMGLSKELEDANVPWGAVEVFNDADSIEGSSTAVYDSDNKVVTFSTAGQQLDLVQDTMDDPFTKLEVSVYPKALRQATVKEAVAAMTTVNINSPYYIPSQGDRLLMANSTVVTVNAPVTGAQTTYDLYLVPQELRADGWKVAGKEAICNRGDEIFVAIIKEGTGIKMLRWVDGAVSIAYEYAVASYKYGMALVYNEVHDYFILTPHNGVNYVYLMCLRGTDYQNFKTTILIDTGTAIKTISATMKGARLDVFTTGRFTTYTNSDNIIHSYCPMKEDGSLDTGASGAFMTDLNTAGQNLENGVFHLTSANVVVGVFNYNYSGNDRILLVTGSGTHTQPSVLANSYIGGDIFVTGVIPEDVNFAFDLHVKKNGSDIDKAIVVYSSHGTMYMLDDATPLESLLDWQTEPINLGNGFDPHLSEDADGNVFIDFINAKGELERMTILDGNTTVEIATEKIADPQKKLYTDGVEDVPWGQRYSVGGSYTENVDNVQMVLTSSQIVNMETVQALDLTDIDELHIDLEVLERTNVGNLDFAIHNVSSIDTITKLTALGSPDVGKYMLTLDVSEYSGGYFVKLRCATSASSSLDIKVRNVSATTKGRAHMSILPSLSKASMYSGGEQLIPFEAWYDAVFSTANTGVTFNADHILIDCPATVDGWSGGVVSTNVIDFTDIDEVHVLMDVSNMERGQGEAYVTVRTSLLKADDWYTSTALNRVRNDGTTAGNGIRLVTLDTSAIAGNHFLHITGDDLSSATDNGVTMQVKAIGLMQADSTLFEKLPFAYTKEQQTNLCLKRSVGSGYTVTLDQAVTMAQGDIFTFVDQFKPIVNTVQGVFQKIRGLLEMVYEVVVPQTTTANVSIQGKGVEADAVKYSVKE